MNELATERLVLRAFTEADFEAVHAYGSVLENVIFMPFPPNREEDTRAFLASAIAWSREEPCFHHEFAVVQKETGLVFGGCCLVLDRARKEGEIGWILHRDFWRRGYVAELGRALMAFAFDELNLHRVFAVCDAENSASFGLMEKLGMRREACFLETRPAHKRSREAYGDELRYAMLRGEWEAKKDIAFYNALPCVFNGFLDVPLLDDGTVRLVCEKKAPAEPERGYVPAYLFAVCLGSERIGALGLRIGYTDGLYYGGQIGYEIDEPYRGHGYAAAACRLVLPLAKAHGMTKLLISNERGNTASRRVCEKLGARHVRLARLPAWTDLYRDGQRFVNIYEMEVR